MALPARQGNYDVALGGRIVAGTLVNGLIRLVIEKGDEVVEEGGLLRVIGDQQEVSGHRRAASVWLSNGQALHVMVPLLP